MPNNTLTHVGQLPIVRELLDRLNGSKLLPLFEAHRERFLSAPAASTMHHNFTHGLVLHTAEVWDAAKAFANVAPSSEASKRVPVADWFTQDELFTAVLLHDFAKIVQYEPAGNNAWAKVRMICNQETWTLRELAKHGIELTNNELVGLLHAEGGYTEFEVDWRPMSAILHAADLWSSQAMKANWNLAEEMKVMCPQCGAAMASRNGPRGQFFGCTKYPTCRGIVDASQTPDADAVFEAWLKRMYPLPA